MISRNLSHMLVYSMRIFLILTLILIQSSKSCLPPGASNKVFSLKETYVCVSLSPLNWYSEESVPYLKISTNPKADEFSEVNIHNSWTSANYGTDSAIVKLQINSTTVGNGMGVIVESMGKLSYQKAYRYVLSSGAVTFPLMMAIIKVNKGTVTDIIWDDDSCSYCDPMYCFPNVHDFNGNIIPSLGKSCFKQDSTCTFTTSNTTKVNGQLVTTTFPATSTLCELNVYVVWSGTDANGITFKSDSFRFSRMSGDQLKTFADTKNQDLIRVNPLPSVPTSLPSKRPVGTTPVTFNPTNSPVSASPTMTPVSSNPTVSPTLRPSNIPTNSPM